LPFTESELRDTSTSSAFRRLLYPIVSLPICPPPQIALTDGVNSRVNLEFGAFEYGIRKMAQRFVEFRLN
jgi:hypothetical protein